MMIKVARKAKVTKIGSSCNVPRRLHEIKTKFKDPQGNNMKTVKQPGDIHQLIEALIFFKNE